MIYGLIIAAGNQTRFDCETPKALMEYKGKTLLDINFENLEKVCDSVLVVTSFQNEFQFTGYPRLCINSGKGCGHAVMEALKLLPLKKADTVFVQWGDSINTTTLYDAMIRNFYGPCVIPCVYEDKPYVQIIQTGTDKVKVLFSKYGEQTYPGWHDCSTFYGNAKVMLKYLKKFSKFAFDLDKHGNEMQFLDLFNETDFSGRILELYSYKTFSFNTMDEYFQLVNENSVVK